MDNLSDPRLGRFQSQPSFMPDFGHHHHPIKSIDEHQMFFEDYSPPTMFMHNTASQMNIGNMPHQMHDGSIKMENVLSPSGGMIRMVRLSKTDKISLNF
jgi:hypothetical protein